MDSQSDQGGLCKGGCGFFGSAEKGGYCSVCAKQRGIDQGPAQSKAPPEKPAAATDPQEPKKEASGYPNRDDKKKTDVPKPSEDVPMESATSSKVDENKEKASEPATAATTAAASSDKKPEPEKPPTSTPALDAKKVEEAIAAASGAIAASVTEIKKKDSEMGTSSLPTTEMASTDGDCPVDENGRKIQTNIQRCWNCRKKVKLMGVTCRCGYTFCAKCRQPEEHDCDFDFKANQQAILTKANPTLKTETLRKI